MSKYGLHCQCLYEIENKLPRTQHCFAPCHAQFEILKQREEQADLMKKSHEESIGIKIKIPK